MRRIRLLVGLTVALVLGIAGTTANAAAPGSATCGGGPIAGGTYSSLTVTGFCFWGGDPVTITGNLTVAPGGTLNDHDFSTATVVVGGNVTVGKGGILGLGSYDPFSGQQTVVDGNITANQPISLYLSFITVHGNVVSNGGGGGVTGEFRNFPTKDNVIDGNLIVQGWTGGWIGAFRNHVGGNLIFNDNTSVLNGLDPSNVTVGVDPDSSEIATNTIGGNLICQGNVPAAQIGDSGGAPNAAGGNKLGQCTNV